MGTRGICGGVLGVAFMATVVASDHAEDALLLSVANALTWYMPSVFQI